MALEQVVKLVCLRLNEGETPGFKAVKPYMSASRIEGFSKNLTWVEHPISIVGCWGVVLL